MRSATNRLITFGKGFGIWLLLLLLNTRNGEAAVNSVKVILDAGLAIMLVGNNRRGKQIALGVSVVTVILTFVKIPDAAEIFLLIETAVLGGVILKYFPETGRRRYRNEDPDTECGGHAIMDSFIGWKARNVFCPFEKYTYIPDEGIRISRGLFGRSYIRISTNNIRIRIDQTFTQQLLGICEVSFISNFTGMRFGEETMRNVRIKSALTLDAML